MSVCNSTHKNRLSPQSHPNNTSSRSQQRLNPIHIQQLRNNTVLSPSVTLNFITSEAGSSVHKVFMDSRGQPQVTVKSTFPGNKSIGKISKNRSFSKLFSQNGNKNTKFSEN